MKPLRLGTRKSALAQTQARWVAERLHTAIPQLEVELVLITTSGDTHSIPSSLVGEGKDGGTPPPPSSSTGGEEVVKGGLKALFTKEIEEALLDNRIDLAVHSLKDMAAEIPKGLRLAAVPVREDARDAWISKKGVLFAALPTGARVATGAVRRQAQLRHLRPDLEIIPIRGNVDTRLKKLEENEWDGLILAQAGLKRLGRQTMTTEILSMDVMLPAVGQGALALEAREQDPALDEVIRVLDDPASHRTVLAERSFLKALGGSCQTPIAAYARIAGDRMVLLGRVISPSGTPCHHAVETGPADQPETIGRRLAKTLLVNGADKILS